jgi:hypothetical protein
MMVTSGYPYLHRLKNFLIPGNWLEGSHFEIEVIGKLL